MSESSPNPDRGRPASPETLAEIRRLHAIEARLRQQLGVPPGPTFHERPTTPGELALEEANLRMHLGLPATDEPWPLDPGGAS